MLYMAFENGLKEYLRFLLGFAYRAEDCRESAVVHTIERQRFINLVDEHKNTVEETIPDGEIKNDLMMVPRHTGPMINLEFVLIEVGKGRIKKKKISSRPDYDDISKDMFSVVVSMHEALKGIKRVETVVFPLLELKTPFLQRPDFAHNAVLLNITKLIQQLLAECTKNVKRSLTRFNQYISIFDKKIDGIILDLKKQSFALANEGEEGSENEGEAGKQKVAAENKPTTAEGSDKKAPDAP